MAVVYTEHRAARQKHMVNFTAEDLSGITVYDGYYYTISDVRQKLNITDKEFDRLFRGCTFVFREIKGVKQAMIPVMDVMNVAVQGVPRD